MSAQRQPAKTPPRGKSAQPPSGPAKRQAAARALRDARTGHSARRRRLWMTIGPIIGVVVLIAIFVVAKASSNSPAAKSGTKGGAAPSPIAAAVTNVPASVLNQIGAGTGGAKPFTALPTSVSQPALTKNGVPRVLYVGAEYCPYCAAERWPITVALSRFGTFHGLGTTSSSPSDVFPNTATLSFHGATFTSSVLAFDGLEIYSNQAQGNGYAPLDPIDAADRALFINAGQGSFPFIDFGGRYVISGASFDPQMLAGLTQQQIANALSDPTSKIARAIDGTANIVTAAICNLTNQQPSTVCTSAGVLAGKAKLGG